jgi:hypothetical protein
METTTLSWTTTVLKDLSQYWNNWTCYNSGTAVNCWTSWLWPQIVDWNWTTWKAMSFDWVDDYIKIPWNTSLENQNMTIITGFKTDYANIIWVTNLITYQNWVWTYIWSYNIWLDNTWIYWNSQIYNTWLRFYTKTNKINVNSDFNFYASTLWNNKAYTNINWIITNIWYTWNIDYSQSIRNFVFGSPIGMNLTFTWMIDDTKVYNQALSDSAIKAIYDATK